MDRISLVTGVSREMGLGFETAKQLSALGHTVIIAARNFESARSLSIKANLIPMQLDVTNDASVSQLAKDIEKRFGKLDVLINNAGSHFDLGGEVFSTDSQFIKEAFDTNLLGAWRMAKACLPLLVKSSSGRIVNVSSGAGSFSDPVFGLNHHQGKVPVYALTKLALNGLTVKMAKELAATNIKVNSVCPGFVATYEGTETWGARPVAEGAKGIVWAAQLDNDGVSGGFFRDGKLLSW